MRYYRAVARYLVSHRRRRDRAVCICDMQAGRKNHHQRQDFDVPRLPGCSATVPTRDPCQGAVLTPTTCGRVDTSEPVTFTGTDSAPAVRSDGYRHTYM